MNIPALGDLPKDILTEVDAKKKELDLEKLDYEVLIDLPMSLDNAIWTRC
jgi:hypothetical protein